MQSKVNWDEAPEWAQYWAMDSDGDAFWYEKSPRIDEPDGVWTPFIDTFGWGLTEYANEFAPTYGVSPENWKQSLSARWACERDRKTSCGRDEVMSNTIVFSEDLMTTEVTRTSDKIKVRAGDGYVYGVDELCTLDDTGNGFIAKFHSNSSIEQPTYFSLDYSHASYLLMALLTEYRLGDTFGKMEVRRPVEESKR